MKKKYLISWCDDNHAPHYWLDTEYLGVDIITIAESLFGLGQEHGPEALEFQEIQITGDSFPDEIWEQMFDYFQTIPTLDTTDIDLIVLGEWDSFYHKYQEKMAK